MCLGLLLGVWVGCLCAWVGVCAWWLGVVMGVRVGCLGVKTWFSKSLLLGSKLPQGARETLPKSWGLRPPPFGKVSIAPRSSCTVGGDTKSHLQHRNLRGRMQNRNWVPLQLDRHNHKNPRNKCGQIALS